MISSSFSGFKNGLFWRTFFLLAFLIVISMAAWVASFNTLERIPRATQIASQVVSVVSITRTALTHSAPGLRHELLLDLVNTEGIQIYPREISDKTVAMKDNSLLPDIQSMIRNSLGKDTSFAGQVNDIAGFWVSFKIDNDEYWIRIDRARINHPSGRQWLGWAFITFFLSLLGAAFISRLINQPLARLTIAARAIASGRLPDFLPERGPGEIREVNRTFNQTVKELDRIESERTLILAGISHDLRTPLARLRLEMEMAPLSEQTRADMQSDLDQMDAIIGQFLDYAKPAEASHFSRIDLSKLLTETAQQASHLPDLRVRTHIAAGAITHGLQTDLKRVIDNLIENARRYGKTPNTGMTELEINCSIEGNQNVIAFADHGSGVPDAEIERILRPFARVDTARSQASGAGLGLAIVERIIKKHQGILKIENRLTRGLVVRITLPALQQESRTQKIIKKIKA